MHPTLDPFAFTPAEQRAEEESAAELAEIAVLYALRPRVRRTAALIASGHLYVERNALHPYLRLTRRRLAIRAPSRGGLYVVIRRDEETVRLPFA